jgi:hypothetical protein
VGIDPRALLTLAAAAAAAGLMFLPALFWVGNLLAPSQPVPVAHPVPRLLADALWAQARGGRAEALQPLTAFTFGRMGSCLALAETIADAVERQRRHDACMPLLPAIEGIGYLASVHMRSEGVWQDPRVPFVHLATMARMADRWTKADLLSTLAARGHFGLGWYGADTAARGYFGRAPDELDLPQAALLGGLIGDRHRDPWCDPEMARRIRRRILEGMRDNLAITDVEFSAAASAPLGLAPPPPNRPPCGT